MSFLSKWFGKKDYNKYGDVLKNPRASKDQRQEALQVLAKIDPSLAIPQLLKRFELVTDSGLVDTKEKEQCLKIILEHGDIAKPFLKEAIHTKPRLSWLLKAAEQLYPTSEYVSLLLENLRLETEGFDEEAQDRNVDLLLALRETTDDRVASQVVPFLHSRKEDVRMAALECLEEQGQHSSQAKDFILKILNEAKDESDARFLGTMKSIAIRHQWISENH